MASSSKKSKKHGRNDPGCKVYRNEDRFAKNKGVRLLRHLKKNPNDPIAQAVLEKLEPSAQRYARAVVEGRQRPRGQGRALAGRGPGAPKRPKALPRPSYGQRGQVSAS